MPRYFFNSEDGEKHKDDEGLELDDEAAARVEAVKLAGDIISDRPQILWDVGRWRVVVLNESGRALFSIEVSAATGAAVTPWG